MHSYRQQSGFTAVELLVTLFVAAAFIIGGYQLFNVVIKDGGETRSESRAANVAYDYLRRYSDSATNPCAEASPVSNQSITVAQLTNVQVSVDITCPQVDAPTLSKVEAFVSFGSPVTTVRYATYVDKSKGASPAVEVTDGLVARYLMNGNGKAQVGGPDADVVGAAPTTNKAGVANTAYSFNAAIAYQYLEINSTFGLSNANATITLWVYQASTTASGQYVKVGGIGGPGFGIGVGGSNYDNNTPGSKIIVLFEGIRWIDTGVNLGAGWHFIALRLDGSGVPSVYRDNAIVGTYAGAVSQVPSPTSYTRIGGQGGRFVTGSIDDVRFYNRALTISELNQIASKDPPG